MQEDEIEAMSLEGLYTTEKIKKTRLLRIHLVAITVIRFKRRLPLNTKSGSKIATTVSQLYFPGSLAVAASQVLAL